MPVDMYLGKPIEACKKVDFPLGLLERLAALSGNSLSSTKEVIFERQYACCAIDVEFLFDTGARAKYCCPCLFIKEYEEEWATPIDPFWLQTKTRVSPPREEKESWVTLDTMKALV